MPKFRRTKALRTPWGFIFYSLKDKALHGRDSFIAMLMHVAIKVIFAIKVVREIDRATDGAI